MVLLEDSSSGPILAMSLDVLDGAKNILFLLSFLLTLLVPIFHPPQVLFNLLRH